MPLRYDAKKLYSGFDLSHPATSVSMTINGPAPMLLGFFMNAAIDQNCEKYIKENPSLGFSGWVVAANIYLNFILDSPTIDLGPIQEFAE